MAGKIVGYIIALIGVVLIAGSYIEQIKTPLLQFFPPVITETYLLIGGIIIFIVGLFFITKGSKSKNRGTEVPIYHKGEVVGYRRH